MERRLRPASACLPARAARAGLIALLVVATLAACRPKAKDGPEEGWIPDPRGPRWVTYLVEGDEAIYQGDIVFPLAELREWQATVPDPIPLRVESYDMLNGTNFFMLDTAYDGAGEAGVSSAPLSGGGGFLTDGEVPDPAGTAYYGTQEWYQSGWVYWRDTDPSITFHFDGLEVVDTVSVALRSFNGDQFPDRVEIRAGDHVRIHHFALDPADSVQTVDISGALLADGSREGLHLLGESVELTFFRSGTDPVVLGEVAFERGTWPAGGPEPDAAINEGARWGATVPYSIASGFTYAQIDEIREALREWEEKSDYTFVENPGADQRIRFKPHDSRCFSTGVGRVGRFEALFGSDVREVRLADGCFFAKDPSGVTVQHHGIVMHEIGHALGFYHEQARKDRSDHVYYYKYNVKSSGRSQYDKEGDLFGDYNFNSIMHYTDTSFGRKMCCSDAGQSGAVDSGDGLPDGCFYQHIDGIDSDGDDKPDTCVGHPDAPYEVELKTMVVRRDLPEDFELGQRWELSKGDVAAANALLHDSFGSRGYHALSIEALDRWEDDASYTLLGDVDNDGRDDLVAVYDETATSGLRGSVHVALGQPDGTFLPDGMWSSSFCYGEVCRLGDLDGDGKKDLVSFDRDSGYVRVAWSYGGEFTPSRPGLPGIVSTSLAYNRDEFLLADLDGNCTDDILAIIEDYDPHFYRVDFWIQPAIIRDGQVAGGGMQLKVEGTHQVRVADVDGDTRADLLYWSEYDHTVSVRLASDSYNGMWLGFQPAELYALNGCLGKCQFADMNGDGRADVVDMDSSRKHHLNRVTIRQSTGYGLTKVPHYHELDCRETYGCQVGDVDGDGRPDLVDLSSKSGRARVSLSTGLWSDDIGELKPRAGGSLGSLQSCLDLPGFDL